ncbi:hypothetical protein [Pasteurella sp. PK-2025]|uniref:hypothetical protein n=1 Tax=Pasteurella sp. PK-2025 TaxID=3413133 RepID=UPI003C79392B
MRTLTEKTKEKLAKITKTEKFIGRDYLLAVLACILLNSSKRNELRADEVKELAQVSVLANAYSCDFSIRDYEVYCISRKTAGIVFEFQKQFEEVNSQQQVDWLFDKVEELASNLENISNFKVLKAIRNLEIANEELVKEVEALENAVLVEQAEKTSETAQILGLPVLKGTPKQVEWAERIRKRCLETMSEKEIGRGLKSEKASYWIEKYKHVLPPRR